MAPWLKLGATAVAAVVVAEGAAWLLSPSDVIDPVSVDPSDFFDAEQVDEAVDYRSGQRLLFAGGLAARPGCSSRSSRGARAGSGSCSSGPGSIPSPAGPLPQAGS